MATAPQPQLPLFYKDLLPLNSRDHGDWKVGSFENADFLANSHAIPLTVDEFVQALGVYPTGSLVKLNTGLLAVVIAQVPSHPLKPLVRTVYNASAYAYVEPRMRDLSRPDNTIKILGYEDPEKFGINVYEFMPLEFEL